MTVQTPYEFKMLIVEDSDEDYAATERALKKSKLNVQTRRCLEGDEALDYMYNRCQYSSTEQYPTPDFILLDLNLPGTDGREVLRVIKSDQKFKNIPVVVFTTSFNDEDVDICYKFGANSYVHKPLDINNLMQAITTLKEYWFDVVVLPRQ